MLERVFDLGEEPRLIEEFGRLKSYETRVQFLVGNVRNCLQEPESNVSSDDGRRFKETFVLTRKAIDASREHRLDGRRDTDGCRCLRELVVAAATGEGALGGQHGHALLEKEGVAPAPLD